MGPARAALAWAALGMAIVLPISVAAMSPLLAWRDPVYIAASLAGVIAMALLLLQPLLAAGHLPGLRLPRGRRLHRWTGAALVGAILVHVAGLWVTSPPDVIDALTFTSPTPFASWGVIAMWALFATAVLAGLRRRLHLRPRVWRFAHTALAALAVACSVVYAMLVDGTMGTVSKAALCGLALSATVKVLRDLRSWALLTRRIV